RPRAGYIIPAVFRRDMQRTPLHGRLLAICVSAALLAGAAGAVLGTCGPFTDISDPSFCSFVLEILYLGITSGTSAKTYDPGGNVSRIQMAKFLAVTVDRVLKRGRRRAAAGQFWTPQSASAIGTTSIGDSSGTSGSSSAPEARISSSGSNSGSGLRRL